MEHQEVECQEVERYELSVINGKTIGRNGMINVEDCASE